MRIRKGVEEFYAFEGVTVVDVVHGLFLFCTSFVNDFLKEFAYFVYGKFRSVDGEDVLFYFEEMQKEVADEIVAFINLDGLLVFI